MRTQGRRFALSLALALVLAAGACQRQSAPPEEPSGLPSNAERESQLAAEQLAALGGPANAATRANYEGEFQASGGLGALGSDEGAWELTLLNDYAQFSRPGLGEDGAITSERQYHERGVRVVAGPLTITVMQEECSTPSGLSLPYVAHVLYEGVAYQGCARRGVGAGERPTWASVLPELIPAIDACLARVSSPPGRVTFAGVLEAGVVGVRIREADGARRECVADQSGAGVTLYETISDVDRRNGEGDPEFQRGGAQPRVQNCRVIEPALGRDGEELGWLIKRGGC